MADEPRPVSRRERREAEERGLATPDSPTATAVATSGESVISAGYEYAEESPASGATTSIPMPVFASPPALDAAPPQPAPPQPAPQQAAPPAAVPSVPAAAPAPHITDADAGVSGMSRRDRRRLERLENPIEEWTQEEEARHTGQTPIITPEVIAQQEFLARQAQEAQMGPRGATGQVPPAPAGSVPMVATGAIPMAMPAGMPPAPPPVPPGGVPPELQHLFPPGGPPQQAPRPPAPPPPAMPSINDFQQLVAPQGQGGAPLAVPGFAEIVGTAGTTPQSGQQRLPSQGPPQQQPAPVRPPQPGQQPSPFEELAMGAQRGSEQAPPNKPPTMPIAQVGAFLPPGSTPPGPNGGGADAPPPGSEMGPGQGMVVPGTGTMRTVTSTGTLRTIPGTGAIPRPIVEVQPAGGASHFGWVQLTLIIAATFALGIVVWNVAQYSK